MNTDRLFTLYERVAEAPDAITRLRRFVLDLAVRGKLVEQDPADEPASELLKRIEVERARAPKTKKLKSYTFSTGALDGDLFDLPTGWDWVPLSGISDVIMGQSPPGDTYNKLGEGVPLINGPVEFTPGPFGRTIVNQYTTSPTNLCEEGDLLICVRGSTTGRTNLAAFRACIGRGVAAIRSLFDDKFIRLFLWKAREDIISMGRGAAFPSISKKQLENLAIPLPPLAEQHRIVARVDELMALCDQLEETRISRENTRDRLTKASFALLSAPDTDDVAFRSHACIALDALPALTARADQVKHLRQTILELAVRGRLVKQDPTEEAVKISLRAIRSKTDALVKSGKLRPTRPPGPILEGETPFSIPDTWIWVRVGDIALFTQYGTSTKAFHSDKGVPVLTMGNIQDGAIIRTNEKKLPENSKELPALFLKSFDLLYNRTNSAELVGKTGIYLGSDDRLTFASYLIRIRLSLEHTAPRFVNFAMNTPDFRETQIVPHIKKQTGQANVSGSTLRKMLIPLPPLPEQHRIVGKVDALMTLCDELEAALTAAATTRSNLLQAILGDALTSTDGPYGGLQCRS